MRDEPEFIETLDYIFLSGSAGEAELDPLGHDGEVVATADTDKSTAPGRGAHWRVSEVLALPGRSDVQGPFPNASEPSDHIMVASTLELILEDAPGSPSA